VALAVPGHVGRLALRQLDFLFPNAKRLACLPRQVLRSHHFTVVGETDEALVEEPVPGRRPAATGYRARINANEDAVALLEMVLIDSAHWCLGNPALTRLALAPREGLSSDPPPNRPTLQGLVRDRVALGQQQGQIRQDEPAGFMALILLAVYGQVMLSALPHRAINEADIRKIVRLVVEGIGGGHMMAAEA